MEEKKQLPEPMIGITYSFHVRNLLETNQCYRQLKYSLTTLRKHNTDIPVKVFISPKFKTFYHDLDKFENVEVIPFINKYPETLDDMWKSQGHAEFLYHRWQNAFKSIDMFGFEKILYLDTDTIFYKDPELLFNKYSEGLVWAREDNSYDTMNRLKIIDGINDGQFLLSNQATIYKKQFDDYINNYLNTMLSKAKKIFSEEEMTKSVRWVMMQYAASSFFSSIGMPVNFFDQVDVALHNETSSLSEPILRHYYSGNTNRYLPKDFLNI